VVRSCSCEAEVSRRELDASVQSCGRKQTKWALHLASRFVFLSGSDLHDIWRPSDQGLRALLVLHVSIWH
jgi:hypothetical protein